MFFGFVFFLEEVLRMSVLIPEKSWLTSPKKHFLLRPRTDCIWAEVILRRDQDLYFQHAMRYCEVKRLGL